MLYSSKSKIIPSSPTLPIALLLLLVLNGDGSDHHQGYHNNSYITHRTSNNNNDKLRLNISSSPITTTTHVINNGHSSKSNSTQVNHRGHHHQPLQLQHHRIKSDPVVPTTSSSSTSGGTNKGNGDYNGGPYKHSHHRDEDPSLSKRINNGQQPTKMVMMANLSSPEQIGRKVEEVKQKEVLNIPDLLLGESTDGEKNQLVFTRILDQLDDLDPCLLIELEMEQQTGGSRSGDEVDGYRDWERDGDIGPGPGYELRCNGSKDLGETWDKISTNIAVEVKSICIQNTQIPILNLTSLGSKFPSLESLTISHCNVSQLLGHLPGTLVSVNLSWNLLKTLDETIFLPNSHANSLPDESSSVESEPYTSSSTSIIMSNANNLTSSESDDNAVEPQELTIGGPTPLRQNGSTFSPSASGFSQKKGNNDGILYNGNGTSSDGFGLGRGGVRIIDLSHNRISELPKAIFYLGSLQSLKLEGNQLKCEFVWEKLWEWYRSPANQTFFKDANKTFCILLDDVRHFQYSVLGILQARQELEDTCGKVDKAVCPDCSLYALQRELSSTAVAPGEKSMGKVAISIKLDCSNRNLSQIPPIPIQTWQLNISNNNIKDLSPLKLPHFSSLLILDADNNEINLESLLGTEFLEKYNYMSVHNNRISSIPTQILSSLRTTRGQGVTFLGGNFIDCDCDAVKEIKPLLIENSNRIKDMKDIFCRDYPTPDGNGPMRVKDLQYIDVCYLEPTDTESELYLYPIITLELLFIVLIVGKVWRDQRNFRRTGILPWCSAKMPRLPCDAMLESVKEPPNFQQGANRTVTGSAASSTTNVNVNRQPRGSSSISHIQLKDYQGGTTKSSTSDKSASQQSQLSSFPYTSSRTSPV